MKRRDFLGAVGKGTAAVFVARNELFPFLQAAGQSGAGQRPNIVLILADDLGYAGVGVQGCAEIPTPSIDSIARNGIRFTHGYVSAPLCSPTRAGLMTGRYQQRFGHETNPGPINQAQPDFGLSLDEPTIAERLKKLGYATGMFGKWHLGFQPQFHPTKRGFDEFYGFLGGGHSYMPGSRRMNDGSIQRGTQPVEEKEYLTDALAREALSFIDRRKNEPFFVYLPFNAVHAPMEAGQKYVDRFKNIKDDLRRTHAAMLSALDDAIGGVLKKLRDLSLEEKTLVIFLSDNGGPTAQTTSSNAPLRGFKGQALEGGIRVPFMMQWKGTLPAGKVDDRPVISLDIHPTVAAAAGAAIDPAWRLDGVDLVPFLTGAGAGAPHETLYWRMFANQRAVRHGNFKLVWSGPEDVKKLQALFDAWNAELAEPKWKPAPQAKIKTTPLTANQRAALPQPGKGKTWFDRLDKNKDGKLTPEEFPRPRIFQIIDTNGDGFVTIEEVRAFLKIIGR
ncbi:MAG: sulfatase-like hydrolase/transferase [Candidatus Aminicenantes bacterium]|nr:sulfatase-like hydrolase/transferase [Candidatus Aminicenantes bacterium]